MLGKKDAEIRINTLLGSDSEFTGDFTAKGSVRLDGKMNGDMRVGGTLIIGAAGSVNGDITAAAVMIGGEVMGNVTAPEKAELMSTARVMGDISTKVLVIDEHAVFQGRIDMSQEIPGKKAKPNPKAVRAGKKTAKAALEEALREAEEGTQKDEIPEAQLKAASVQETEKSKNDVMWSPDIK
nr:polymer-forming cytoskeletal protein [uncultured Acetatifactor sp.]